MWAQFEQSRKNVEEAELLAERERQMQMTMPSEPQLGGNRKRKASETSVSTRAESVDASSLFMRYLLSICDRVNTYFVDIGQFTRVKISLHLNLMGDLRTNNKD